MLKGFSGLARYVGLVLGLLLTGAGNAATEDWQELRAPRLAPVQPAAAEAKVATGIPVGTAVPVADDALVTAAEDSVTTAYAPVEALIEGAFGITFGQVLEMSIVAGEPVWINAPTLPAGFSYAGEIKPLAMLAYAVAPPQLPVLLTAGAHTYECYVDATRQPFWVRAGIVGQMAEILAILTRKYGAPEVLADGRQRFDGGANFILASTVDNATGTLDYVFAAGLKAYLGAHNKSLRHLHRDADRSQLTPGEQQVIGLADQFTRIRKKDKPAFGLPFSQRVGFRASPGEAVAFEPPLPIEGLGPGDYSVTVSSRLWPTSTSFSQVGSGAKLAETKALIDQALLLAFGGFLKQTSKHSVISLQGVSISVLIRDGRLTLSVHDSLEIARALYERKAAEKVVALAAAEAERQRQAAEAREEELRLAAVALEEERLAEAERLRLLEMEQGF